MQKLLAIIITIALYAPPVADILAFAECSIEAIIVNKEDCGCTIDSLHNNNQHSVPANLPSKQTENDLKFFSTSTWKLNRIDSYNILSYQQWHSPYYPASVVNDVFHPPGC